MSRYDLLIIGGGTAGLTAAVGAAGVGARVLLAEEHRTGGDCLWTGCVPSKTLLATAHRAHQMRTADRVALTPVAPQVDLGAVMSRVRDVIAAIEPHDSPERLRRLGVEVVPARARFLAPGLADVGGRRVRWRTALIATGSAPVLPPIDGIDDVEPLTSDDVWQLTELPPRLVVLGGGPVGVELGQALARLGSHVTIVEQADRLLPSAPARAGRALASALADEGIEVRTAARVTRIRQGELNLRGDDGRGDATIPFDRLLVAAGRRPRTAGLGLDLVGVDVEADGRVRVDDTLRTTGSNVFAAGDVTGWMPFTHVAGVHGGLVVTNALFGLRRRFHPQRTPWTVFTDPEIAHVGLDEASARARWGDQATVTSYDYAGLDRSIAGGSPSGFATLVADPSGRLVGATIVGDAAGESIATATAWITARMRLREIGAMTHAYPTMAEGPWRAALEHLREAYLSPRTRRAAAAPLWLLRHLDRPRLQR